MSKRKKKFKIITQLIIVVSFIMLSKIGQIFWNLSLYPDFKLSEDSILFTSFNRGAIVLFVILLLIYLLTNNYLLSIVLFSGFTIAVAFANHTKVSIRNEFITFADLKAIFAFDTLLPAIADSVVPIVGGLLLMAILIGLSIFGMKRLDPSRFSYLSGKTRMVLLVIWAIGGTLFFNKVEAINNRIFNYQLDSERTNIDPVVLARKNGFVSSYLHTVSPTFMYEPADYSKKTVNQITDKYQKITKDKDNIKDEKTVVILSESFISTLNYPNLLAPDSEEPTPYINQLIEATGGYITPKSVGGGTANTEFSILSGFTLSLLNTDLAIPFTDFYEASENHSAINKLIGGGIGVHSHTAKLYNRKKIYDTIGFSGYRFLDEGIKFKDKLPNAQFISDKSFYNEILDVLPDNNFVHALSIQNHFPYKNPYKESDLNLHLNESLYLGKNQERFELANNYFKGTHETDKSVESFISEIEKSDDKINIIFYGDHLPGSVVPSIPEYKEAGKMFETPFFIYRNHGREVTPLDTKISPAFLFSHFLNTGNYQLPGFYNLVGQLIDAGIGDIMKDTVMKNGKEVPLNELTPEQESLVKDYQMIQFDALFGDNFSGEAFFENK